MLHCASKLFAKAMDLRTNNHMKKWICKEKKGFIKRRCILDAIISFWEGSQLAKESKWDFLFFKINFENTYNWLNWEYII